MFTQTWLRNGIWLLAALTLAACSGSATPQLIAAYPRAASATYVPPSRGDLVVSDAYIDLRVADVRAAAEQAEALAYDHGGYVAESTSWFEGERLHSSLTLAVPLATYDSLHDAIVRLGTLADERIRSRLIADGDGSRWNHFASITVHIAPMERAWRLPAWPSFGWSPLTTFRAAFGVFAGIATFLIDILIWLTVVLGPFGLLALGLRALIRRWRPR